jgi:hypothetical protein
VRISAAVGPVAAGWLAGAAGGEEEAEEEEAEEAAAHRLLAALVEDYHVRARAEHPALLELLHNALAVAIRPDAHLLRC